MAEVVVSGVLKYLSSFMADELGKEARLVVGVKGQVEKLHSSLTAIQAVLTDAETRPLRDAAVRYWLEKLKDVAYDIEDVLDDWKAEIPSSQYRPEDEPLESKVCSFLWSLMTFIPCFCCKLAGLRRNIAMKTKELNERLDLLAEEKKRYNLVSTGANQPIERSMTVSMIDITEVKGRDEEKNVLVDMLLSEPNNDDRSHLHILSIVGMGGIGKTTLAQFAFNHDRIKAHFGDYRFWVCVSDPFDETRVAKAILSRIPDSTPNVTDLEDVLQKIGESIKNNKFLLVLDDVWEQNPEQWNKLKPYLECGVSGSKALVTTRKKRVATKMGCVESDILEVGNLSNPMCWSIIKKIAFLGKSDMECKILEETFSEKMSEKCKGLPLAAKALGGYLQSKTREGWQSTLNSKVFEEVEEDEEVEKVIQVIQLSYQDLSPKLKRCFSYCAMFPKGYEFKTKELIELWIAQGYLRQSQSNDLEVTGENFFQNLAMRSFFQDFTKDRGDGSIYSCKMHDIVHDFAQMVARNECCSAQMVDDSGELIRTARHLCLDLPKHGPYLNPSHGFRKKRSLFLWSKPTIDELTTLFDELTHVRSLSLRNGDFAEIPFSVRKLVQLRWLDLSHNWQLKQLPETLCELHSLQTIDISCCSYGMQLPHGMGKLINLRHLHNDMGPSRLPKGIAELTGLRTLEEVDVGCDDDEDAFSLGDLKNLNQLRGSLKIRGLGACERHVDEAKEAELKRKEHITQLHLCFSHQECTPWNEELLLEALEPFPYLEELDIDGYRGTNYPGWMISLANLRSIYLVRCGCEHLPSLGKLPSLETLSLRAMLGVKKVGVEFLGIEETQIGKSKNEISASASSSSVSSPPPVVAFPKLTTLEFDFMDNWEKWDDYYDGTTELPPTIQIMPSLYSFRIDYCLRLKALPDYIRQNTTLKNLLKERINRERKLYLQNTTRNNLLKERINKEKGLM